MTEVISLQIINDVMRLVGFCPVTLITTIGKDGSTNAAPHSRYTIADYNPPQIIISVDTSHDTYRNIIETKEFVLNIPDTQLLKQIWITQKRFPYGINELDEAGLTTFPAEKVKPPRIVECNGYIECRVLWSKITGSSSVFAGAVESISVKKSLEKLTIKEWLHSAGRLIFLSYDTDKIQKNWIFGEIGKIHYLIEDKGEIRKRTEFL